MKRLTILFAAIVLASSVACAQGNVSAREVPAGSDVAAQKKDNGPAATPAAAEAANAPTVPAYREITVPAGTILPLDLKSSVASDTSHVEDRVTATLRRGVLVGGTTAIPAGTTVIGYVTDAKQSARVKGRARIAFRFTEMDMPGEGGRMRISTGTVARQAPATKKKDAAM